MKDQGKSKEQLIDELVKLRQQINELEKSEKKHKRTEEALRETEERFRTIFENTFIGMYRTTPDGRIIIANPALVRMLGYSSFKELAQRNLEEKGFKPEYPRSIFKQNIESEGHIVELESAWIKKDGTVLFVLESAKAIRDDAGNIIYYEGTVEDITKRKRAEQELRIKESAIASSINAIALADLEGNLTYANNSFLKMWNYDDNKDILGKPLVKFWQTEEKAFEIVEALRDRRIWLDELVAIKKDGSTFDVQVSANLVTDKEGKPICMMASFIDITKRKQAEEEKDRLHAQLIHSEKMAGIGTLASGIAHEFNNLLQIMRGYTEFAQRTKKPEDMEEALGIVLDTSDRVTKIIKDLLIFSRPDTFKKELCDITEIIESVLSITEIQLEKHNIHVVRKYEKTPLINLNKPEFQQVFLNMVTNARDAMLPRGGKLEISVNQVGEDVEVSFTDTGKGIEKENIDRVFEPFYTTKGALGGDSKLRGTGLGLSVSFGIVNRHSGTIEVESELGKGTTFTVKLPSREVEPKKKTIKAEKKKKYIQKPFKIEDIKRTIS